MFTPTRVPILARYGFGAVYTGGSANTWGVDPLILANPSAWSDWFATNSANRTNRWCMMQVAGQIQGNTYGVARWNLPHLAPFLAHWLSVGPSFAQSGVQMIDYGGTRKPLVSGQYVVHPTEMLTGAEEASVPMNGVLDAQSFITHCLLPFVPAFPRSLQIWCDALTDSYVGAVQPSNRATPENDTMDALASLLVQANISTMPVGGEAVPRRFTGAALTLPGAAPPIASLVARRPWIHLHTNSHDPLQLDTYDPATTEVHMIVDTRPNALVAGQAAWWMIDEAQTLAVLNRYVEQGQIVGIGGNVPAFVWNWFDTYSRSLLGAWQRLRSRRLFLFS